MADFTNENHEHDNYIIDTSSVYSIRAEFENVCFGWEMQRVEEASARQKATDKECEYIARLITKTKCTIDDAVWHYERSLVMHKNKDATDNRERKKECGSAVKNLIEQINKLGQSDD